MVSLYQCYGNLGSHEVTMKVIGGGEDTLLSAVRPYRMDVSPNGALNMSESPHLIIGYVLNDEHEDLV